MVVGDMPGLFPLAKFKFHWQDYYIDAGGNVFSTKKSPVPQRLRGSTTSSGHYYTLSTVGCATGDRVEAELLLRQAKAQKDFMKETEVLSSAVTTLDTESSEEDERHHAGNLQEGIAARGFVIARVEGEALVFGSKPKVHVTLASVRAEMERLALKSPGLQLVYLQIEGACRAAKLLWA